MRVGFSNKLYNRYKLGRFIKWKGSNMIGQSGGIYYDNGKHPIITISSQDQGAIKHLHGIFQRYKKVYEALTR